VEPLPTCASLGRFEIYQLWRTAYFLGRRAVSMAHQAHSPTNKANKQNGLHNHVIENFKLLCWPSRQVVPFPK
jgi:hypothetical protein